MSVEKLQAYQTFKKKKMDNFSQNFFLKNNNETNKQNKFKSKKESPWHSAWKDLQSKTVTKNPILHNLN